MKTSTEIIVALNVLIESCYLPSMKYLCIRKRSCHFSSFLRQAFALSPLCLHFLPINIPSPWVLLLEHWSRGLQHQSSTWWKKLMQLYQHHFFKCYPRSNISADTLKRRLNTNSVTILLARRPDQILPSLFAEYETCIQDNYINRVIFKITFITYCR